MYGCESRIIKKADCRKIVLEKTLESPLHCEEIKPVNPKWNQPWIFIGRTDAEAEVPILWSPDAKNWLTGKDPDAGKDWGQEEKGTIEDEMVGWHHWLDGHEFEQALGIGDGQETLACWSPWGRKESDMTEELTWQQVSYSFFNIQWKKEKWVTQRLSDMTLKKKASLSRFLGLETVFRLWFFKSLNLRKDPTILM